MRYKKKGPPHIAVMTPTGNSAGDTTTRAMPSQIIKKEAPISTEAGIRIL